MNSLYPFLFNLDGMTQSYLWGGNKLRDFGKPGNAEQPLAEVWEISDRPEDERVSVITNGPLAGKTLRWLMENYQQELMGNVKVINGKFPLLVKLLDAKQRLSLQVHPPASVAAQLGGQSKTECWLLLDGTDPSAKIIAGLEHPITMQEFKAATTTTKLEPLLHSMSVKTGDAMLLPSGRLHAIDAGCLILEIQENSNTTYRVFDWNRIDPITNQPRQLHLEQALASIDFADVAPTLAQPIKNLHQPNCETLATCPQFTLERWQVALKQEHWPANSFEIITCLSGNLTLESSGETLSLPPFTTVLIPSSTTSYTLHSKGSNSLYSRVFVPTTV